MATIRCARRHARGHQRQRCRQRVGLLVNLFCGVILYSYKVSMKRKNLRQFFCFNERVSIYNRSITENFKYIVQIVQISYMVFKLLILKVWHLQSLAFLVKFVRMYACRCAILRWISWLIVHLHVYVICTTYSIPFFPYFVSISYAKGETLDLDIPKSKSHIYFIFWILVI